MKTFYIVSYLTIWFCLTLGRKSRKNQILDASKLKQVLVAGIQVGSKYYIQAVETTEYLSRCNQCGSNGAYPDSAAFESKSGGNYQKWKVVLITNSSPAKIALQADTGNYLAVCVGCWQNSIYPNAVFVHATSISGTYTQWVIQRSEIDYTWSFQPVYNNQYLKYCDGCVSGNPPDLAFADDNNANDGWTKFLLIEAE